MRISDWSSDVCSSDLRRFPTICRWRRKSACRHTSVAKPGRIRNDESTQLETGPAVAAAAGVDPAGGMVALWRGRARSDDATVRPRCRPMVVPLVARAGDGRDWKRGGRGKEVAGCGGTVGCSNKNNRKKE